MAKWITLTEIDVKASPLVTKRYAVEDTPGPDGPYLGLLQSFPDFVRGGPKLPGLPVISQFEVGYNNHDKHFSKLLDQYELRGCPYRMLIGLDGAPLSSFAKHFTGKIIGPPTLTPEQCSFSVKDQSANLWKQDIPNDIPASDFPNLPEKSPEARANIIFGYASSIGKGDQGAVNCPLVDTVDHLYLLARHRCFEVEDWLTVYVLGGDGSETYDIVEYEAPSGRVYTLIRAHKDWEDPTRTATEFAVSADVKGLFDEGILASPPTGDGHLITNPAEAVRLLNTMFAGFDDGSAFNEDSYNDAFDEYALAEYSVDGCIDALGTIEDIIKAFQQCFNLDLAFDEDGLMYFHFLQVEEADPADAAFDDALFILLGTFKIEANDDVVNALAIHYDRDPSSGKFLKEPPVVNNLLSQAALGLAIRQDLEMPLVSTAIDPSSPSAPSSGDLTAMDVASVRLYYSDEGRWICSFLLSAPEIPASLKLFGRIKVSHPWGLAADGSGWTQKLFRVFQLRYLDLTTAPMIEVRAMMLEPGPTAYMLNDEPCDVDSAHSDETAAGLVNVYWNEPAFSPSCGPLPAWLHIWFKRVEDELSSRFLHFAGRVAASAHTFRFEALFEEAGDLDIYLRPESADGVIKRDMATVDHCVDTSRTKISARTATMHSFPSKLVIGWDEVAVPDEVTMFRAYEIWFSTTNDFSTAELLATVATIETVTYSTTSGSLDRDVTYYFWVVVPTRYGVRSDESNVVSGHVSGPVAIAGGGFDGHWIHTFTAGELGFDLPEEANLDAEPVGYYGGSKQLRGSGSGFGFDWATSGGVTTITLEPSTYPTGAFATGDTFEMYYKLA